MIAVAFQRARTPEQQDHRRRHILATARAMLDELPLVEISLRELSARVGLAKSNVVRYFPCREAVFLAVLVEDWDRWLAALEQALPRPDRRRAARTTNARIAEAVAATLAAQQRLCALVSASPAILEQNIPAWTAREFKAAALARTTRLAGLVRPLVPALTEARAFEFAGITWALLVGAWPIAHPTAAVAEALTAPELAPLRVEFVPAFASALTAVLDGLTTGRYRPDAG